jgi:hypothetical protein
MAAKLTISNIDMAPLRELAQKLNVVKTYSEQVKRFPALLFTAPFTAIEAARQQLIIDKYKTNIVILTNSEEAAGNLVDLALAFARTTPERNETVFSSVMGDILARLARGDSVANVAEWISNLKLKRVVVNEEKP